jgi:hypothetical protein
VRPRFELPNLHTLAITNQSHSGSINLSLLEPVNSLKERVRRLEVEKRSAREWHREQLAMFNANTLTASFKQSDTFDIVKRRTKQRRKRNQSGESTRQESQQQPSVTEETPAPAAEEERKKPLRRGARNERVVPNRLELADTAPQVRRNLRGSLKSNKTVADLFSPISRQKVSSSSSVGGSVASLSSSQYVTDPLMRPGSPVKISTGAKALRLGQGREGVVHGLLGQTVKVPEELMMRKQRRNTTSSTETRKPLSFASYTPAPRSNIEAVIYLDGSFAKTVIEGTGSRSWAGSFERGQRDNDAMSAMSPVEMEGWSIRGGDDDTQNEDELVEGDTTDLDLPLFADNTSRFSEIADDVTDDGPRPPRNLTPSPRVVSPPAIKGDN